MPAWWLRASSNLKSVQGARGGSACPWQVVAHRPRCRSWCCPLPSICCSAACFADLLRQSSGQKLLQGGLPMKSSDRSSSCSFLRVAWSACAPKIPASTVLPCGRVWVHSSQPRWLSSHAGYHSLRIYPYPTVWPLPRPWSQSLWAQKTLEAHFWIRSRRPRAQGVGVDPVLLRLSELGCRSQPPRPQQVQRQLWLAPSMVTHGNASKFGFRSKQLSFSVLFLTTLLRAQSRAHLHAYHAEVMICAKTLLSKARDYNQCLVSPLTKNFLVNFKCFSGRPLLTQRQRLEVCHALQREKANEIPRWVQSKKWC